ncbi:hypothetical protein ACHAXT_003266 [Thalassiosira profunda]
MDAARSNTSLHLRNNNTVVSGTTDCSVASATGHFGRGSGGYGGSGGSMGGYRSEMGPIAEEDEWSAREGSVAGHHHYYPAEPHIAQHCQPDVLSSAFDAARHPAHAPKPSAVGEIDVALYQEMIADADEIASLPEEYVIDARTGERYHLTQEVDHFSEDSRSRREEVEILSVGGHAEPRKSPFGEGRRVHSLLTVLAAVLLAVVGLTLSVRSLSATPHDTVSGRENSKGVYLNFPGHQLYGGGTGGLEGGQGMERRYQLAAGPYATGGSPASDAGHAPAAAMAGFGGGRSGFSSKGAAYRAYDANHPAVLTARPLTSYAPPPNEAGATVILAPQLDQSFMELSVLPYNPQLELPVVLDVPLSGGAAIKSILGGCLKMVQCNERGRDILAREREEWMDDGVNEGRRSMMELVPRNEVRASNIEKGSPDTGSSQKSFDPPLRTELVYTSEYVNVDCSTPEGIDRGVDKGLASANLVDSIYSTNLRDTSRLFAPPVDVRGRAIVVLRDPIERAVAKYNWLSGIDEKVKEMTLEQFASGGYIEDNILTRALVGKRPDDVLSHKDLILAKEMLKRKFVVGLFDRMDESIARLESFFGWKIGDGARVCQQRQVGLVMTKEYNKVIPPAAGSAERRVLMERVGLDAELYEYARFLYDYQGRVLFGLGGVASS